jgi:hypothetical protein
MLEQSNQWLKLLNTWQMLNNLLKSKAMRLIRKIFHLSDFDANVQQLKDAQEDNDRILNYIAERQKELSEVNLSNTIEMIDELKRFIDEHKN